MPVDPRRYTQQEILAVEVDCRFSRQRRSGTARDQPARNASTIASQSFS